MVPILTRLPWGKIIIGLAIAAVFATMAILKHNLNNARDEISQLQTDRGVIAAELGVKAEHPVMLAKLKAMKQESDNRRVALQKIDAGTLAAKKREAELDAALRVEQERNRKLAAESERTIKALRERKPGSNSIDADSKTPWNNWKFQGGFSDTSQIIDDHKWSHPAPLTPTVTIQFFPHKHLLDVRNAALQRYGLKDSDIGGFRIYGFTFIRPDGVCEVHTLDPAVNYQPAIAGHEMLHCFYGAWHEARI